MMYRAMDFLEKETCINFVPINPDEYNGHYIYLTEKHAGECSAFVGHVPSKESPQEVRLSPKGCFNNQGTVEHELLHVLGLDHEQNRPDRDFYIHVLGDNIHDGTYM